MIEIKVKISNDNYSFEQAVGRFKKEVKKDGFLKELRDRRYFRTNGEKIKAKQERNRRNKRIDND